MRRSSLTAALLALLMGLGVFTAPPIQPVLATVAPSDLTYPSTYWNSSSVFLGPHINNLVLTILDRAGQTNAIINGTIDLMTDPSGLATTNISTISGIAGAEVGSTSYPDYRWLGFNFRAWADPSLGVNGLGSGALARFKAFRVAVDYSIPRANVVASQLGGYGFVVCEADTPAWVGIWNGTSICRDTGTTAAANRPQALASLSTLLGKNAGGGNLFTNKTSGCIDVSSSWCFANGTTQMLMNFIYPNYDSVRKYVGDNIVANLQAVGFGAIGDPVTFATIAADETAYTYNVVMRSWGLDSPLPYWMPHTFSSASDTCPYNETVGEPGCTYSGGNPFGLHDSVLDGYLNIINTNTDYSAIVSATKNMLFRLYSEAEFLTIYSQDRIFAARNDLYNGYFNRPSEGMGGYTTLLYEQTLLHPYGVDFYGSAATPADNPSRPATIGISSDITDANRWESGFYWDIIVNQLYEGANTLNYLDPADFSLHAMTASLPNPGDGSISNITINGVPGVLIKYTLNRPGPGQKGLPVWLDNHRFVTIQDYLNTLQYIKAVHPANYAALDFELAAYNVTGNTLNMYLNGSTYYPTGYWRLYETNIPPTYAPYWCDKNHSGTPDCTKQAKDIPDTLEPVSGSQAELDMFGNSTTGPFVVRQHVSGTSFSLVRNKAYWLSPACDVISVLNVCPKTTTPVFGTGGALLLIMSSLPVVAVITVKRRTKK